VLQVIGTRANHHRRAQRPAWETKLHGRSLALLSEPVGSEAGDLNSTLADVIADHTTPERLYLRGAFDRPVEAVLDGLKDEERAVALAYAYGTGFWADAAKLAGVEDPEKAGERVRRKLKRLGNEYKKRRGRGD
jgi:DNA-directed RNA polymerase specialized sigma24 family protein